MRTIPHCEHRRRAVHRRERPAAAGMDLGRRHLLAAGLAAAVATPLGVLSRAAFAQTDEAVRAALPLRTTGLEHLGTLVPDVAASGEFYARVFNPELHKEREGALRYYVPFGVGYLAIGAAGERPTQIDHYCALVEDYDRAAMAARLEAEGVALGRVGMIPDADGNQLQLLAVPGGLAPSTESAGRIVSGAPLFSPLGLDNVVVRVTDVERALPFYRLFFGMEAGSNDEGARFAVAGTSLVLEKAAEPGIARYGVRVGDFDRRAAVAALAELGAEVGVDDGRVLRFTDPDGLEVEVKQGS